MKKRLASLASLASLVLLVAITGCAGNLLKGQFVLGNGQIGSDCDEDGHCATIMKGGSASSDFLDFILRAVDGIPGVELGSPPAPDIHFHAGPGDSSDHEH